MRPDIGCDAAQKKTRKENQSTKYFSAGDEKLEKSKSTVALYTAQAKVLQHYTAGLSRAELTNGRRRLSPIWAGLGWADRYRYRGLGWAEQG